MQQPPDDDDVQHVPKHTMGEGGAVGARKIEDCAGGSTAERHAEDRRHDDDADPRSGLAGGEVLAHYDRVARDDPALQEAENRRDGFVTLGK